MCYFGNIYESEKLLIGYNIDIHFIIYLYIQQIIMEIIHYIFICTRSSFLVESFEYILKQARYKIKIMKIIQ